MKKAKHPTQEEWSLEAFGLLNDLQLLFAKDSDKDTKALKKRLEKLLSNFETAKINNEENYYAKQVEMQLLDASAYHDLSTL